jgi:hypothetical protein
VIELMRTQIGRRPAADEDGVGRPRIAEQEFEFAIDGRDVLVNSFIGPGRHGEVAVAAMVITERDVDVRGAGN